MYIINNLTPGKPPGRVGSWRSLCCLFWSLLKSSRRLNELSCLECQTNALARVKTQRNDRRIWHWPSKKFTPLLGSQSTKAQLYGL